MLRLVCPNKVATRPSMARGQAHRGTASVRAASTTELYGTPASMDGAQVIISGGGMAGIGCAVTLVSAGIDVLLVEQGRGLGGRVCTRRAKAPDGRSLTFDHGAQYLAPKPGSALADMLPAMEAAGAVARWGTGGRLGEVTAARSGRVDFSSFRPWAPEKVAWVGTPTMSAVGRFLTETAAAAPAAGRLVCATGWRVAPGSLQRGSDGLWTVLTHPKGDEEATVLTKHAAVFAAGSASSAFNVIAPAAPALAAPAAAVRADACWALLVAFPFPLFPATPSSAPFDGALISGGDDIAWFARDASKPGRGAAAAGGGGGQPPLDTWVVHATAGWSNARRDAQAKDVAEALLAAFLSAVGEYRGPVQAPSYVEAFRWNAAFPLNPPAAPGGFYADEQLRLGMCGDWCIGPRAGDAFESGVALARWHVAAMAKK